MLDALGAYTGMLNTRVGARLKRIFGFESGTSFLLNTRCIVPFFAYVFF